MVKHLQGSPDSKPLDQDLVALPTRLGGLSKTLYAGTASLAFQNSRAIADITSQSVCQRSCSEDYHESPSPRQNGPRTNWRTLGNKTTYNKTRTTCNETVAEVELEQLNPHHIA
jgi:hypothetical protein